MIPIGYDETSGTIVIMGNGVYPACTMRASVAALLPDHIQIASIANRGEQNVLWSDVTSLDGSFRPAGLDEALAYLSVEFCKRPANGLPPLTFTAGEPLSGQRAVRIAGSDSVLIASSDDVAQAGMLLGVTMAAADEGMPVQVMISGEMDEATWSFSPGPVFLGLNGALVQAPPAFGFVQQIGTALSPTRLVVARGVPLILAQ